MVIKAHPVRGFPTEWNVYVREPMTRTFQYFGWTIHLRVLFDWLEEKLEREPWLR